MSVEEVMERLGISRSTLTRRIREGEISPAPKPPGLKRPKRLEFKREDIEKLAQG